MSDWRATHSDSIDAGLDQEMPGSDHLNQKALESKAAAVDRSALRVLTPLFAVGAFDRPGPLPSVLPTDSIIPRPEPALCQG